MPPQPSGNRPEGGGRRRHHRAVPVSYTHLPELEEEQKDALPQEEATALEEWLKELYPDKFSKVTLGKRLVSGAAVALQLSLIHI